MYFTNDTSCLIDPPKYSKSFYNQLSLTPPNARPLVWENSLVQRIFGTPLVSQVRSSKETLRSILETVSNNDITLKNELPSFGDTQFETRKMFLLQPLRKSPVQKVTMSINSEIVAQRYPSDLCNMTPIPLQRIMRRYHLQKQVQNGTLSNSVLCIIL